MEFLKAATTCGLLWALPAGAQVPNDDCSNAQELDLIIFSPACTIFGQASLSLIDSTDLALPDFPYPINPGPCFGYWVVPNAPTNDRWYKFLLPSGDYLEYTFTALDSVQLSWWQGFDCAFLSPIDCSILLPGETIHRLLPGAYHPGIDTLFLQVSSTSVSSTTGYDMCYRDTWFGTTPISYGTVNPTPVLCFDHEMTIAPVSNITVADGVVDVSIVLGNGPFTIFWDDGSTDFHRTDLWAGIYPCTITDGDGCMLADTAIVGVGIVMGLAGNNRMNLAVSFTDGWVNIGSTESGVLDLFDELGRCMASVKINNGCGQLTTRGSRLQVVLGLFRTTQGLTHCTGRVLIASQ